MNGPTFAGTLALATLAAADDLHIAPLREDGVTFGTPTWIWSVVVDDALYVRAYHGQASRWHQAAMRRPTGQITVAGHTLDVVFEPVTGEVQSKIDDVYRAKYASSPYLASMISPRAKAATVQVRLRLQEPGSVR